MQLKESKTYIGKRSDIFYKFWLTIKNIGVISLPGLLICVLSQITWAQSSPARAEVPEWALPGSATHKQVPPPPNFHRATKTANTPIGIFKGQSDVGAALTSGSSSYNSKTKQYTINSAGYNVWYTRDEFRFLWKKMDGDVSLAADVSFPDSAGYGDRKAIVIIRQSLNDDSKEAMVALHGAGLMHLAWRPETGQEMKEMRVDLKSLAGGTSTDDKEVIHAKRIGIEKHGDNFSVFVSVTGEPMHQYGKALHLPINGPFYVGIGFCSHLPNKVDAGMLSNVTLVNAAGNVK